LTCLFQIERIWDFAENRVIIDADTRIGKKIAAAQWLSIGAFQIGGEFRPAFFDSAAGTLRVSET
jgi:hypothetical protein